MRPVVVLAGAALALTASTAATERTTLTCEADAAGLKTLSDPQRSLVRLRPTVTTIAAIDRLTRPHPTPTRRTTRFQRHVWRLRAQIVEYRLEQDGDIDLVLYDAGRYLTATMPHPRCLSAQTRARKAIVRARALLEGLCGPARSGWHDLGAVAVVDGVGYWGTRHAELRPVTGFRLVAGCA